MNIEAQIIELMNMHKMQMKLLDIQLWLQYEQKQCEKMKLEVMTENYENKFDQRSSDKHVWRYGC